MNTLTITDNRQAAISTAQQWLGAHPIFLDTETTGKDGNIVDICLINWEGRVVLDSLVNPRIPIPEDATAVHGITHEMVWLSPTFQDLWEHIETVISGRLVIAYNVDFDHRMLLNSTGFSQPMTEFQEKVWGAIGNREASKNIARFECAMKLYARFKHLPNGRGGFKWFKLSEAAQECGITLPETLHRARADTELCRLLVEWIARQEAGE